jgi:hypothetical protein
MQIERVKLGPCTGYVYPGDATRAAAVLPGAMLGGMPVNMFVIYALVQRGWTVVQVWDEWDGEDDRVEWAHSRADAALAATPNAESRLIVAKSLTTLATDVAARRKIPAIWLTPLLHDEVCVSGLRKRSAPALLVGGTADELWDGALARQLSEDILELPEADHGFCPPDLDPIGILENQRTIVEAVGAFVDRL